jgi:hypothetical protein
LRAAENRGQRGACRLLSATKPGAAPIPRGFLSMNIEKKQR